MHLKQVKSWFAALLLVSSGVSLASAEPVDVPAGALTPGTSVVIWADADGFNERAIRQAYEAVVAVAPAEDQERMRAKMDASMADMKTMFDACEQLKADGVHSAVFGVAPQDEPGVNPQVQVFFKAQPGSDPKAALAKGARAFNQMMIERGDASAMTPEQLDAKIEQTKFVKVDDQWFAMESPDGETAPLPTAGEAVDPQPFLKAMNGEEGAPVRFAFVMNNTNRDAIKQSAADPNNMMMAGIMTPLVSLDSATGGVWLGQQPKLRISMNFADEASAQQFKTALDQMLGFFGQMLAMQAAQNPNVAGQAPDMAQVQAVIPLLFMDQNGPVVSKTFDTSMLTKLTEAGIPWAQAN